MPERPTPRRGDIFWVNLDPTVGSEVRKARPAVILSNDAQNSVGQRVLAAPITSNVSRVYSFEAEVGVGEKRCKAMLDQVRCLDRSRLQDYVGRVSATEMRAMEKALRVAFDLT